MTWDKKQHRVGKIRVHIVDLIKVSDACVFARREQGNEVVLKTWLELITHLIPGYNDSRERVIVLIEQVAAARGTSEQD